MAGVEVEVEVDIGVEGEGDEQYERFTSEDFYIKV